MVGWLHPTTFSMHQINQKVASIFKLEKSSIKSSLQKFPQKVILKLDIRFFTRPYSLNFNLKWHYVDDSSTTEISKVLESNKLENMAKVSEAFSLKYEDTRKFQYFTMTLI